MILRFAGYFAIVENWVLSLAFVSTLSLAILQIVLRNFFDMGFLWLESFLRIQVLWLAMLGAMVASREGQHIKIDLLTRFVSGRMAQLSKVMVSLFAAVVCWLAAEASVTLVQFEMEDNLMAFGDVPIWVCQLILPVGFSVMGLRFLAESVRAVQGV
ncbi:MAG: TRAP transporter small permease, partial [Pseudomonadales bacterium]